jgi:hypothetical protein
MTDGSVRFIHYALFGGLLLVDRALSRRSVDLPGRSRAPGSGWVGFRATRAGQMADPVYTWLYESAGPLLAPAAGRKAPLTGRKHRKSAVSGWRGAGSTIGTISRKICAPNRAGYGRSKPGLCPERKSWKPSNGEFPGEYHMKKYL